MANAPPVAVEPYEELELKLKLNPKAVSRLRRSPLLRDHKIARAGASHLISTYYDTPSLALKKKKAALRIRKMGRALEQTLKSPKGVQGSLQSRAEWNAFITTHEPDIALIGDVEIRSWLEKRQETEGLSAVFKTDIKRTTWQIVFQQSRFEVALDLGEIRSGERRAPICEVELELVSGRAADLLSFALRLIDAYPLVVDRDSKAARGYALFLNTKPEPVRASEPDLSNFPSVPQAFAAFVRSGVEQLMSNVPAVNLGEDPEGIHQARVGVRRLRSALSLFKPVLDPEKLDWTKAELRWLQAELGCARDLDVFILETLTPLSARLPKDAALSVVSDAANEAKLKAYTNAIGALQSARYSTLLVRLEEWLLEIESTVTEGPDLLAFAKASLEKRLKRVLKGGGKAPSNLPEDDLHPLRIDLKKLRYAASFFRTVFSEKQAKPYIRQLGSLQDCLGGLNDALVQRSVLETLDIKQKPAELRMQGMLDGWHAARTEQGLSVLDAEWTNFRARTPFWKRQLRRK